MKKFSIHISIENHDEYAANFAGLLEALSFDEKTTYDISIDITKEKKPKKDAVLSLIDCEQTYGKKHKAIFRNTLICDYSQLDSNLIRTVLRHGMEVVVHYKGIFGNEPGVEKAIRKLKSKNIPYYLSIMCPYNMCRDNYEALIKTDYNFHIDSPGIWDMDLKEKFDEWCDMDGNCPVFKPFEDVLYRILMGHTDRSCLHSSCLGKRISMKSNGDLYFCHKNCQQTYLKNISSVSCYSQIFDSQGFLDVLSKSIERREKCMQCKCFSLCQSGCPILCSDSSETCMEDAYCRLVHHIGKYLYDNITSKGQFPVNPIIRRIVLVSIAFRGKVEIDANFRG